MNYIQNDPFRIGNMDLSNIVMTEGTAIGFQHEKETGHLYVLILVEETPMERAVLLEGIVTEDLNPNAIPERFCCRPIIGNDTSEYSSWYEEDVDAFDEESFETVSVLSLIKSGDILKWYPDMEDNLRWLRQYEPFK